MKKYSIIIGLISILCLTGFTFTDQTEYDYIIRGGRIVDGMSNPWFRADIGIKDGIIVKIGRITPDTKGTVIDAADQYVTPGFIDMHSHGERNVLNDRTLHNLVTQGMTTIVGGNCGGSPLELEDFFKGYETSGASINLAVLFGHNTIRRKVMGNAGRTATDDELNRMKDLVASAMKAGAIGMSTGLKYRPGIYSPTEEVIELTKVVAEYGGFYSTHLRDGGLKLFTAMEEAFEIGEKAGVPVQLSHHKAAGADMWGQTKTSLQMMEVARARGLDVTTDQHPYPATMATITIIFPAWALEGDRDTIMARLKDPETRIKVREGIVYNIIHDRGGNDISNVTIAMCSHTPEIEGLNLRQILEKKGIEPTMDNAAELMISIYENGSATGIYHCLSMDDVVRIMQHPLTMHASDAGNAALDRGKPHPRHYGHFPRIIAKHVRDDGDLRLEEAIRKMTSFPASRIGARDRGIISEGKCADIVIFDINRIQDRATFQDPHQYAEGIDFVLVNGEIVVDHGKVTGKTPGKIIYGPGKKD